MDKGKVTPNEKTTEAIHVEKEGLSVNSPDGITPSSYADAVKKGIWIGEQIQPSTSTYVKSLKGGSGTQNQGESDIYYSDTVTSDPSKTGGKPSYAGAVKGKYSMNVCVLVCA